MLRGAQARERAAAAVYAPGNVRDAAFVVAIVVSGRGRVEFDAARATQNMLLEAWNDGVGGCPNGVSDADAMTELLGLAENERVSIVLTFGHPARRRDPARRSPRGVARARRPAPARRASYASSTEPPRTGLRRTAVLPVPRPLRAGRGADRSGLAAAARDRDLAGARHLDQAEGAHHALERLDLLPRAGDLDDHRALRDVDDLAAEDLDDLHDLAARGAVGGDLEQRELARDRLGRARGRGS